MDVRPVEDSLPRQPLRKHPRQLPRYARIGVKDTPRLGTTSAGGTTASAALLAWLTISWSPRKSRRRLQRRNARIGVKKTHGLGTTSAAGTTAPAALLAGYARIGVKEAHGLGTTSAAGSVASAALLACRSEPNGVT